MSATMAVTTTTDEIADPGPGTGCSLREAIYGLTIQANYGGCVKTGGAFGAGDTINIPAGTYTTTIASTNEDLGLDGDFDIRRSVAIVGAGAGATIINGGGIDRVFSIDPFNSGVVASISGVTITNGNAPVVGMGGGIFHYGVGTLTVTNSTISGNTAGNGGGISNWQGTLTVTNSTISGNTSAGGGASYGGGIHNNVGTVNVTNSSITGNTGTIRGGGIYNIATFSVTNSTISGNSAIGGAGSSGGGIYNSSGALAVTNSTITSNSATASGGGIFRNAGTVTLSNTIVANQSLDLDCVGVVVSNGYNLESATSCGFLGTGDLQNKNPLLGALASNGGSTQTMALSAGSPAIDKGSCVNAADQRGTARPQGGACDIGAYEYGVAAASTGISGCTNSHAENYNPSATVDDGSCRLTHPDFSGNASTVNVGNVAMNGKASKTITITNSGNGSAWFYSVDISGGSFTIVSENCSNKSLQPGKSCEIVISFDPKAKGTFTGTLKLWSNSGSYRPLAISLTGVGTGSAPSAAELVTPVDGESGTGTTVTFTWNLGADNGSGALTHKVFVCEKSDFSGCETPSATSRTESDTPMGVTILIAGLLAPFGWRGRRKVAVWVIGILIAGGLTISACGGGSSSKVEGSNKQTVSGLKASTTYYWKVTEVSADGSSTDSAVRSFTTGK